MEKQRWVKLPWKDTVYPWAEILVANNKNLIECTREGVPLDEIEARMKQELHEERLEELKKVLPESEEVETPDLDSLSHKELLALFKENRPFYKFSKNPSKKELRELIRGNRPI